MFKYKATLEASSAKTFFQSAKFQAVLIWCRAFLHGVNLLCRVFKHGVIISCTALPWETMNRLSMENHARRVYSPHLKPGSLGTSTRTEIGSVLIFGVNTYADARRRTRRRRRRFNVDRVIVLNTPPCSYIRAEKEEQ